MAINENKHICCFIIYLPNYINSMLGSNSQVPSGKNLGSSHGNRVKAIHSEVEFAFAHKY